MKRSMFRTLSSAVLALLVFATLSACGLKGAPHPDFSRDAFGFGQLSAVLAVDGAVTVSGELTGQFQNADYFVLQMQPVEGELCTGCPFVPQDQYRFDASDAWESENGSKFSVVYLPIFPAQLYRWRIVGHNVYSGIPTVVSDIAVVGTESAFIEQGLPAQRR